MSLKEKINDAVKQAMRDKDDQRKTTLRGAQAAIKQIEVDQQKALNDNDILGVLQKEVKMRHEAIADAEKAGRDDLVAKSQGEIAVLEEFLPKALSQEELETLIKEAIEAVGAETMADMGKVMGAVMPKVKGRADGGQINQIVRQHLQG